MPPNFQRTKEAYRTFGGKVGCTLTFMKTSHLCSAHPPVSLLRPDPDPDPQLNPKPRDMAFKPQPLRFGGRLLPALFILQMTTAQSPGAGAGPPGAEGGRATGVGILAHVTSCDLCRAERLSASTWLGCCEDEPSSCPGRGWEEARCRGRLA